MQQPRRPSPASARPGLNRSPASPTCNDPLPPDGQEAILPRQQLTRETGTRYRWSALTRQRLQLPRRPVIVRSGSPYRGIGDGYWSGTRPDQGNPDGGQTKTNAMEVPQPRLCRYPRVRDRAGPASAASSASDGALKRWPGQIIGRDTQVIVARVHARAGRLAMATTDPAPVRKDLEAAMISGVSARGQPPLAILDSE